MKHHAQGIKLVPRFDDLAVAPPGETESCGGDTIGGRWHAQVVAVMRAGEADPGAGEIPLGDHVFDGDPNVGKSPAELSPESNERFSAARWRVLRSEPVDDDVRSSQLVNGRLALLVPDFLEPPADKRFVVLHAW